MHLPENFQTYGVIINGKKNYTVSDIFKGFGENPRNTRESELLEATVFGKCLEIWDGETVMLQFVNEEATRYKGIYFFLNSKRDPKCWLAFQLIEYKAKYSQVKNTEGFADWIIEKKFKKGDKKIHLLVSLATKAPLHLNLKILREKLKHSPYASIILLGPIKLNNNFYHTLIGLNKYSYSIVVDVKNNLLLKSSEDCPHF